MRGSQMPANESAVAVGYLRRSTDRQEQSIDDQQAAIERYALERGIRVERFFVDDAISGSSAQGRPAFLEMVDQAQQESCPFSRIIVYDVTRFGRLDNDEAGYYRHILRMHGVEVVYSNEGFRGDDTDDLLRPVKQWQAREESRDLSKVTIRGLLSRIEGGFWNGGVPPYGYDLRYESPQDEGGAFLFVLRYQPDGTKLVLDATGATVRALTRGNGMQSCKRDRCRLVHSAPERVQTVRRIFTLSVEDGLGNCAIANTLNQEGVSSPRGPGWARIYTGHWSGASIRSIILNPLYVGDLVWNRRTESHFFKITSGRASERRSAPGTFVEHNAEEDWIRIPNAHPAIVSRRQFQAAQGGRATGEEGRTQTRGSGSGCRSKFLLSGLGVCARCGGRYQGCHRTKGKADSAVRTAYYGCGSHIRKGLKACRFGPVKQGALEHAVVEAALGYYRRYQGEAGHRRLCETLRECVRAESAASAKTKRAIARRLKEIDAEISRLRDLTTEINRPFVEERIDTRTTERCMLEKKHRGLESLQVSPADYESLAAECQRFLGSLENTMRSSPQEIRTRAFRRCVKQIIVDQEAGTIQVQARLLPIPSLSAIRCETIARVL